MEAFTATKRKRDQAGECPAAKRHRPPDFQLSKATPRGMMRTYKYTPTVSLGVTALFSMIWGQLVTLMEEELNQHQFKSCLVFNVELTKNNANGGSTTTEAYFRSDVMTILSAHVIELAARKAFSDIQNRVEKWTREGSGWTITKVLNVYLDVAKYTPLKGSSYVNLPTYLRKKKAIVNVKNNDQQCLKWALLSARFPVKKNSDRVTSYINNETELNFTGVNFPTPLSQIPKVELQNNLGFNVMKRSMPICLTTAH